MAWVLGSVGAPGGAGCLSGEPSSARTILAASLELENILNESRNPRGLELRGCSRLAGAAVTHPWEQGRAQKSGSPAQPPLPTGLCCPLALLSGQVVPQTPLCVLYTQPHCTYSPLAHTQPCRAQPQCAHTHSTPGNTRPHKDVCMHSPYRPATAPSTLCPPCSSCTTHLLASLRETPTGEPQEQWDGGSVVALRALSSPVGTVSLVPGRACALQGCWASVPPRIRVPPRVTSHLGHSPFAGSVMQQCHVAVWLGTAQSTAGTLTLLLLARKMREPRALYCYWEYRNGSQCNGWCHLPAFRGHGDGQNKLLAHRVLSPCPSVLGRPGDGELGGSPTSPLSPTALLGTVL